jgi:ADP-ribose pyrophosphatase
MLSKQTTHHDAHQQGVKPMGFEQQESRQTFFKGHIIQAHQDTVRLSGGRLRQRDVVTHPGGVCVLPVLDADTVLLIEQFRYATGELLLEAPAGKLDITGESPFEAVQRELEEETGHRAAQWQAYGYIYTAPGFCDERIYLYLATELTPLAHPRPCDEEEHITLKPMTRLQLRHAMSQHTIKDAKTLALLAYWL